MLPKNAIFLTFEQLKFRHEIAMLMNININNFEVSDFL